MRFQPESIAQFLFRRSAFTRSDLLATIASIVCLAAIGITVQANVQSKSRMNICLDNLQQIGRSVTLFANDHNSKLPGTFRSTAGESWWWYKEEVKGYLGLTGPSSADDRLFACPLDRGYTDPLPFHQNSRFDYTSYVFNGVTLVGTPNIAGWNISDVIEPKRTLSVMEWCAHAPLSWHRSKTGKSNAPFYSDAESISAFVDGSARITRVYYDGYNAAYTRDPISGYQYRYSGK